MDEWISDEWKDVYMDGWMDDVRYIDVWISLINFPVCINLTCNCLRSLPQKQNEW